MKKLTSFAEKAFLTQKLNNWLGFVVLGLVALVFGYLIATHATIGLGIFVIFLGILVAIICMANAELGLYITVIFSFFAYLISRFLFYGTLQIGVIWDGLILVTFLGLFVKGVDFKSSLNEFLKTPVVVCMLFLLFYLGIEMFNPQSRSFDGWFLAFRKFLGGVLLLFTAYTVFDSYERIKRFLTLVFVLCVLAALYGCIQQWHGYFDFEMQLILADEHGFGLIFVEGEFRKYSTMSDPAAFGILMAACSVLFLVLANGEKNVRRKWIMIAGSLLMILSTGYSGTRTAYAIIVAGLAYFILLNLDKKSTRIFGIFAVLAFLVLMYAPYSNKTIYRFRTTFSGSKDESYNVRVKNRKFIQPYIYSHPLGGGLGTSGASGMVFHPGHYLAGFQPDSSYLKKATETGWLGLILICVLYFIILKTAIQGFFRTRSPQIKQMYAACLTCIFSLYVAEFAQVAIGQISDIVVYFPLVAVILKLKNYDQETDQPTAV